MQTMQTINQSNRNALALVAVFLLIAFVLGFMMLHAAASLEAPLTQRNERTNALLQELQK